VVPQPVLSPLTIAALFGGDDRSGRRVRRARAVVRLGGSCAVGRFPGAGGQAELRCRRRVAGWGIRCSAGRGRPSRILFVNWLEPSTGRCLRPATYFFTSGSCSSICASKLQGFTYFDVRDLLGFVEGTENPVGAAASAAVLIHEEDPEFVGGSYVIVQKYLAGC
jgi:putative iron-dependent peroxidase